MRIFLLMISLSFHLFLKSQHTISGKVVDAHNEPQQNVMISGASKALITTTLENGTFSIPVFFDSVICFSKPGFVDTCVYLSNTGKNIEIKLEEKKVYAQEVFVFQTSTKNIRSAQTGIIEIKTDSFRNLPSILGESDPMKLLQLAPGVSKSDFNMGLNVRGSTSDQNLVLIDDAVIYNPSHLAGFLSVFNPLVVKKLTLIKSGIPAEYGGRASSITIVETDKNIALKPYFESNVGILLSGFVLKTPLWNKKISLSISARKSYIDQTIKPLSKGLFPHNASMFNSSNYGFYDINAGLIFDLGKDDKLYINCYLGRDNFLLQRSSFNLDYSMDWGNQAYSAKWLHHFGSSHTMKTISYYSKGDFGFFFGQNDFNLQLNSSLSDLSLSHEHSFYLNKFNFKTGISSQKQHIIPNKSAAELIDFKADFGTPNDFYTVTSSAYMQADYSLSAKTQLALGIRYNEYFHIGPYERFVRTNGINITDTIEYKKNSLVKNYGNWEPRLSVSYLLNQYSSLKFSGTRNIQYLQQINVSSVALPTDFWMPASYQLKPQEVIQFSMGFYKNAVDSWYSFTIESFYKHTNKLTEFKKGILSTVSKAAMEENIIIGYGRSYGLEVSFEKKNGPLTGWISYTLSRSERIFKEINNGKAFPSKYDRTHDFSLVANYKINQKWSSSLVFVLASGNAVTLPIARYMVGQNIVNQYADYNSFRMPLYHRLDFSLTRTFLVQNAREHGINFGLYNAYSRLNPFFMYFGVSGDLEKYKLKVTPRFVSIFPVLPFITYNFKF